MLPYYLSSIPFLLFLLVHYYRHRKRTRKEFKPEIEIRRAA